MAEEKKSIFSVDGAFFRFGTLVFDLMLASLIWSVSGGFGVFMIVVGACSEQEWIKGLPGMLLLALCFLLVVPASASLFYAFGKRQRGRDKYITGDIWRGYKSSFGKGFLLGAILRGGIVLMAYLMLIELTNYDLFKTMGIVLAALQGLIILILLMIDTFVTPLLARFDLPFKQYLKLGFFMSIKHLPTTVVCLLLTAVYAVLGFFAPYTLILLPGAAIYLETMLVEKVFRKYLPKHELEEEPGELSPEDAELISGESQPSSLDAPVELDPERQAIIDRYKNQKTK